MSVVLFYHGNRVSIMASDSRCNSEGGGFTDSIRKTFSIHGGLLGVVGDAGKTIEGDEMNWPKIWDKMAEWSKGLRSYVGMALTTVVSPAIQDANVNIELGPVQIPVAKLVDVLGGMLLGVGMAGKVAAYQTARSQGMGRMAATGHAATQGPLFEAMKAPFRGGSKIPK